MTDFYSIPLPNAWVPELLLPVRRSQEICNLPGGWYLPSPFTSYWVMGGSGSNLQIDGLLPQIFACSLQKAASK